ncbi:hypothetical protein ScPMuIL_004609 [Solemya velum]
MKGKERERERERRNSEPYARDHEPNISNPAVTTYDSSHQVPVFQEHSIRMHRASSQVERRHRHSTDEKEDHATELSTDEHMPGMLKIFGDTIFPSVQYKTVLASCRSTAKELVKQALERYGISVARHGDFVLCDVVGKWLEKAADIQCPGLSNGEDKLKWHRIYSHEFSGKDKPLLLQQFWRPVEGLSRRYELRRSCEFADDIDDDDTCGLNANARKISIAKLRPGVIPVQLCVDSMEGESFSEDLKWDYTFSKLESPPQRNEPRTTVLERLISDHHSRIQTPVFDPEDQVDPNPSHTALSQRRPYLLTLRSQENTQNCLIYTINTTSTVIGNGKETLDRARLIALDAPDIAPIHCFIYLRKYRRVGRPTSADDNFIYYLDVEPCSMAAVCVNGWPITSMTKVNSGDTLSIGKTYVFVFKDDVLSIDDQQQVSRPTNTLTRMEPLQYPEPAPDPRASHCTSDQSLQSSLSPLSPLSPVSDDTIFSLGNATTNFPFCRQKEDQLLKAIGAVLQLNPSAFALTPTYIYCMCIEHSRQQNQLTYFWRKVIVSVKETVKRTIKVVSENPLESGLLPRRAENQKNEHLWSLMRWLSNCVQLGFYLRNSTYEDGRDVPHSNEDRWRNMIEISKELEDVVTSCFQQTVYTITKVIYALLPLVLESNPFSDKGSRRHANVGRLTAVLDVIAEQANTTRLNQGVTRQLFSYVFFFTSTSIFNRIFSKDTGSKYYNWASGVRVRANLSHIEDWATRNDLLKEFSKSFDKLIVASELLSTSKTILMKYDWQTMKENFQSLNECQLYRMLRGYQNGKEAHPFPWQPPPEDIDIILREDSLLVDMSSHPPFVLPDDMPAVNLQHLPEDPSFWTHFRQLRSLYAAPDDNSDSDFSLPAATQKKPGTMFYSEMSPVPERSDHRLNSDPNRKVKFRDNPEFFGCNNSPFTYKKGLTICGDRISSVDSQTSQDEYASDWSAQSSDVTSEWSARSLQVVQRKRPGRTHPVRQYVHHQQKTASPASRRQKSPQTCKADKDIEKWRDNVIKKTVPKTNPRTSNVLCKENYMITQKAPTPCVSVSGTRSLESPGDSGIEFLADLLFDEEQTLPTDGASLQDSGLGAGLEVVHRKSSGSMLYNATLTKAGDDIGLGLVDGLCTPLRLSGVYIKEVVTDGPASKCGELQVGDRILSLNGQSIFGCDFKSVVASIRAIKGTLTLLVAKGNNSIATKIVATSC